jgi:hypothetical protein
MSAHRGAGAAGAGSHTKLQATTTAKALVAGPILTQSLISYLSVCLADRLQLVIVKDGLTDFLNHQARRTCDGRRQDLSLTDGLADAQQSFEFSNIVDQTINPFYDVRRERLDKTAGLVHQSAVLEPCLQQQRKLRNLDNSLTTIVPQVPPRIAAHRECTYISWRDITSKLNEIE